MAAASMAFCHSYPNLPIAIRWPVFEPDLQVVLCSWLGTESNSLRSITHSICLALVEYLFK